LADVLPFDEKTTVKGKIDTELEGVVAAGRAGSGSEG
jgi:hypothetical protein